MLIGQCFRDPLAVTDAIVQVSSAELGEEDIEKIHLSDTRRHRTCLQRAFVSADLQDDI